MRRAAPRWPAAVAVAAALLAGCGALVATQSVGASPGPAVSLAVRYDDGAGTVRKGRLTCNASGQHATGALAGRVTAARQCARVRAIASLLTHAPPAGRACTQIYGGPQTMRVDGKVGGSPVHRTFKRTNGCEIDDFGRVAHALPIARRQRGRTPASTGAHPSTLVAGALTQRIPSLAKRRSRLVPSS